MTQPDDDKRLICPHPFFRCEIGYTGDINSCCPAYNYNYSFGNLHEHTLGEIWRGEKAEYFRDRILAGDYSLCDFKYCMSPSKVSLQYVQNNYYENCRIKMPRQFVLSHDAECNLACNICRKKIHKNNKADLDRLQLFEKQFFPFLGDCDRIKMSGAGDPFASEYNRGLIKRIVNEYPKIKFVFLTNGLLFTPEMIESVGLSERIFEVGVSIHAASPSVYKAITRSPNFRQLLENLKFLSDMKKIGTLPHFNFKFVVSRANYQDMPAFVDMAEEFDAMVDFTVYRYLDDSPFAKNFSECAIYLDDHPEHTKLLEILKHKNLRKNRCRLDGTLKKLQKIAML